MDDRGFVLFGGTGDLAQRMLWPSLFFLDRDGLLPPGLRIVANARQDMPDAHFVTFVRDAIERRGEGVDNETWDRFAPRLHYCSGSADTPATFERIKAALGGARDLVHFLATSPTLFRNIVAGLKAAGLAEEPARIVVEKPIGRDLGTCNAVNEALAAAFHEERTFRIDHYLGKETVLNLLALRFANALFEPLWNKVSIDHVQISVGETVGVEGRGAYYDGYGALRDMVQSHVLQLLCLVAMEPPSSLDPDAVRNEKVKVLRALRPINGRDAARLTVRGQFRKGFSEGKQVEDYRTEVGLPATDTETFVALCAHIDNWRWAGVPFYLRTGKRMPDRSSHIAIQFKQVPHSIFPNGNLEANRLMIRLQPEEEISLTLMNKQPTIDAGFQLQPVSLDLSFQEIEATRRSRRRIAYERLILDALKGNSTLFVRRDEVEAAWTWIDAIEAGWLENKTPPSPYAAGTWPSAAFGLIERDGRSWFE